MVVKQRATGAIICRRFESRVILDGSQTLEVINKPGDGLRVVLF